jgi:AcrR family transcriptional regulator
MISYRIPDDLFIALESDGLFSRTFRRLDPERRSAVLSAIIEDASESGPEDLSVKRVAKKAGVAVGSLYQYFENREKLVRFAVVLVSRSLAREFSLYAPELAKMPLREGLELFLNTGIEWAKSEGGFLRFYAVAAYQTAPSEGESGIRKHFVRPIAEAMQEVIRKMIAAAFSRGELREDIDVETAARLVNVGLIALGDAVLIPSLNDYYLLYDRKMKPKDLIPRYLDLLERGISKRRDA